ncbi:hypothetical protein [Cutibacterium acnes]|uniref:hypothetical protein n=1 Tax=Cutibacterium acnes TaxID=1747 RepID=UPI00210BE9BE|nr:hypothetical protein [Cutibacterium acnes]
MPGDSYRGRRALCMVGLVVPRMKVLELGSTIPLGGLVSRIWCSANPLVRRISGD